MTDQQHPSGFPPPVPPPTAYQPGIPTAGQPLPGYQAPAGAYQVPAGGFAAPAAGYAVPAAPEKRSAMLGALSLIMALVAAVAMPVAGAFTSFAIGRRLPDALQYMSGTADLAFLAPARDQVLWTEITFWAGTALGIAALVAGIIAIAQRRGRGQGIGAVVVAVLGPGVFALAVFLGVTFGAVTGIPSTFS